MTEDQTNHVEGEFPEDTILFSASTSSIFHIYRVLKAISSVADVTELTIVERGMKFSVETTSKACQGGYSLAIN
jgi:hypothetical protein